ncbi:Phospholipase A-2-activating protein [Leucoagaricus sp. SymC.cos]|nr:Phospholipase A-2-activating protein [Leucoagaricus sp. SymC.cos]
MPYKLSATLTAHTSDVRALNTPTNELVVSASRDTTAISWQKSENGEFHPTTIFRPGSRYVNAITYLPPTPDAPKGYVVTGGQDIVINVFSLDPPKEEPSYSLLGHTENVCTLDVSPGGSIISGSWDRTAKVWANFQFAYDLKGHQQAVWAVKAIDEEQFLTASADKTVKLWQRHKAIQTFTGHQDAVRGLALIPDIGFASCANDGEIRVWTLGGDLIYTLSGHSSFVYSLAVLPNGDLVSAGEDRSVRIWQGDECTQVLVHPAISVWAVSVMPNGDIVSGCSDGVIRIFSASKERWVSEQDLKEYEDQVASQALPSQQIGDVKKSDLPGPEALSTPGKKPGEVKMVKKGDVVEAHQWDSSSSQWQKIGDVVDAVGSGRKQLYQGKEYDYVFDVDIQDGVPPLKLPYNVTENPYAAAQRFLQANEISMNYLDQVAQFIEKNTSGVNLSSGGDEYVDPYTGASRYRNTGSGSTRSNEEYADPFTGTSRYRSTASIPTTAPSSSSYADPFTGASRYNPSGNASASQPSKTATSGTSNLLPVPKALNFKQANVAAMQRKLSQFNDLLKNEAALSTLAMSVEEQSSVSEIFVYLAQAAASPPRQPVKFLASSHIKTVIGLLERWPNEQIFPVIDLCRLLAGFSPETFRETGLTERFIEGLFKASQWSEPWSSPLPKVRETNILLVLRTFANVIQEGTQLHGVWFKQVLESLGQVPYTILGKNLRVAFSTVLFNVSCIILRAPIEDALQSQYFTLVSGLLASETTDSEAAYRSLVALGNVAFAASRTGKPLTGTQIGEANQYLRAPLMSFPEDRIRNLSAAVAAFF